MKKYLTGKNMMTCYAMLISFVFPLFITNYYYNIQKSKSLFFILATVVFAILFLVFSLLQEKKRYILRDKLQDPSILLLFAFLGLSFLSAIFSPYKGGVSLTGEGSRSIGFLFLLSGILCTLILRLSDIDRKYTGYAFLLGGFLAAVLGIFNFIGMNLFGLVSAVPASFRGRYLSTIGYINFFSQYLSLVCAYGLVQFSLRKERAILPVLFILYTALLITDSNGGLLGFLFVLLVLPLILRQEKGWFLRFTIGLLPLVPAFPAAKLLFQWSGVEFQPSGLTGFLLQPRVMAGLCIALLLLFAAALLLRRLKPAETALSEDRKALLLRAYRLLLLGGFISLLLILILSGAGVLPENPLTVDDGFANYRGYIWRRSLQIFGKAPFMRKLFGYGPDTLKLLYQDRLGKEMSSITGQIFDSAHSFVLQYLLSTGILGLLSLIAAFASLIAAAVRNPHRETLPFLAALAAFLIQAFFVPGQPLVSPLFFLLAGIVCLDPKRLFQRVSDTVSQEPPAESPDVPV